MTEPKILITLTLDKIDDDFFVGEVEEVAQKLIELKNKWSKIEKGGILNISRTSYFDASYYGIVCIRTETDEEYNKRINNTNKNNINKLKKAKQQREKLDNQIQDLEKELKN